MRIALLADAASVHTQRWVQGLVDRGFRVSVWSEREWPGDAPVAVYRLNSGSWTRMRWADSVRRLRDGVGAFRPDIVHAHYVSRYGLWAAWLGRRWPRVFSVWGADVEVFPQAHGGLNRYLLRAILAQPDRITASSRYLAEVTRQYTSKPVTVVPFGIDRTRFGPKPPNRGPLRWMINKALEPVYGIDVALEAWARVPRDRIWEGQILGTGTEKVRLERLAVTLGVADRIHWRGPVAPADLPEVLAWADLGIYPSRRESFGVAPLEMQALGRAVMAHRVGGLPEVIRPDVTGYLIEPGDLEDWVRHLTAAADDPEAVRRLGQNGPDWVAEHYDFQHNVDQMVAVYEAVLKRGDRV